MDEVSDSPGRAKRAQPGLRRQATQATRWALVETWGSRVITTVVFLFLARALGPEEFGLIALAVIFVELGNRLVNQGFGSALVQRQRVEPAHLDTAFWVSVSGGVVLMAVTLVTAPLFADLFDAPQLASVLRVLSLKFLIDALSNAQQSLLQRELRFGSLAARRIIAATAGGVVGLGLAFAGAGVWALVAQNLVMGAVGTVVLWSVSSWTPGFRVSREHFVDMLGFGSNVVGIEVLRFLSGRGEKLLVGAVMGPVALGFYTVARRFPDMLNDAFTRSIARVAFPTFARLQAEPERQTRALHEVLRVSTAIAGPLFVALAVMAPEMVRGLIGDQWDESIVLLQLLALQGLVRSHLALAGNVVMASGHAGIILYRTGIETVMKFVALAIALPHGIVAVAWAVVIYSYASAPLTIWALRRANGVDVGVYLRQLVRPLTLSIAMGGVVLAAKPLLGDLGDLAMLVVEMGIAGLVYLLLMRVFARDLLVELGSYVPGAAALRRRFHGLGNPRSDDHAGADALALRGATPEPLGGRPELE